MKFLKIKSRFYAFYRFESFDPSSKQCHNFFFQSLILSILHYNSELCGFIPVKPVIYIGFFNNVNVPTLPVILNILSIKESDTHSWEFLWWSLPHFKSLLHTQGRAVDPRTPEHSGVEVSTPELFWDRELSFRVVSPYSMRPITWVFSSNKPMNI